MTNSMGGVVLVPQDLSSTSVNAAWRAGMVARDLGLSLRLLHADADLARSRAAAPALQRLAGELRDRLGLPVELEFAVEDPVAATVRASRGASLLVIGSRRGNFLRELVLGTPAERLIRVCRVPVLVVKRPARGSYRRVLAPVEIGPDARALVAAALRLTRARRVEVLHALDLREEIAMRAFELSEAQVRLQRQKAAQRARWALEETIAGVGASLRDAAPTIGFGDAAMVVLARERAVRAELLVIGKRARAVWTDFFLGSVTQRVLAATKADVLVLPRERNAAAVPSGGAATLLRPQAVR